MQRITISLDGVLAARFDDMIQAKGYQSRSEGVRDLLREGVERWGDERSRSRHCVGSLSYVYNRQTRSLAQRLSEMQHDHHDLIVATTLVHLDHDHTLESVMLRGLTVAVRTFADQLRAERGVRFGALNLVGVDMGDRHTHGHAHGHGEHEHLSPHPG